jgi:hypothetical protein
VCLRMDGSPGTARHQGHRAPLWVETGTRKVSSKQQREWGEAVTRNGGSHTSAVGQSLPPCLLGANDSRKLKTQTLAKANQQLFSQPPRDRTREQGKVTGPQQMADCAHQQDP